MTTKVVVRRPKPNKGSLEKIPSMYDDLCNKLDYKPIKLLEHQLRNFLFEKEISIYDTNQVDEYLQRRCTNYQRVKWVEICSYKELIPERVLRNAVLILDAFPETRFFVSEIVDDPDPFICLQLKNIKIVFGVWDEPGFSG